MDKSNVCLLAHQNDEDRAVKENFITESEELKNYLKASQQEQQDWKNSFNELKQKKKDLQNERIHEVCPEFNFRAHLSEDMQCLLSECEQIEEKRNKEVKRLMDQIDHISLIKHHYEQQRKQLEIIKKNFQDRISYYQRAAIMKTLDQDCDFDLGNFCQSGNDCDETTFLVK